MKTLSVGIRESELDLHAPETIDAIELTDEELEQATGSWFGSPGFRFGSPGFGFGSPGFGFGGFSTSFTSVTSVTNFTGGGFSGGGFGPFF